MDERPILSAPTDARMSSEIAVTTAADDGPGSLRRAILDANAAGRSPCRIVFRLPEGEGTTIRLRSPLPEVTAPIVLDGTTRPGVDGRPVVAIDGGALSEGSGLTIAAEGAVVRGLIVGGFPGDGIALKGGGGHRIEGNAIGVDRAGDRAIGNQNGIAIHDSVGNRIGGTDRACRNLISGNRLDGIVIHGGSGNVIEGNAIGTDADGTSPLGNGLHGVDLRGADNLVGGPDPAARNVISGNGGDGVVVYESGATGNRLQGNYIGVDATGSRPLPNGGEGVGISDGAAFNLVGGPGPGEGNVISGNRGVGLVILRSHLTDNRVQGNLIGVDATGSRPLGNARSGICLFEGASGNLIGGLEPGAGNVIGANGEPDAPDQAGIMLVGEGTTGNRIFGNAIGTDVAGTAALGNRGQGVLLGPGASQNLIGDVKIGAGNRISHNWVGVFSLDAPGNPILGNRIASNQSRGIEHVASPDPQDGRPRLAPPGPPILASAVPLGDGIELSGTFQGEARRPITLQFFRSGDLANAEAPQGADLLRTVDVVTDPSGLARFTVALPARPAEAFALTATATDPTAGTSTFAAPLVVDAAPAPIRRPLWRRAVGRLKARLGPVGVPRPHWPAGAAGRSHEEAGAAVDR